MSRDRAAYMREYRAKNRRAPGSGVEGPNLSQDLEACREEVARLKRELAQRTPPKGAAVLVSERRDYVEAFRQFRPVPKSGRKRHPPNSNMPRSS